MEDGKKNSIDLHCHHVEFTGDYIKDGELDKNKVVAVMTSGVVLLIDMPRADLRKVMQDYKEK